MRRFLNVSLLVVLLLPHIPAWEEQPVLQAGDPAVEALLAQMGPSERVGQLFLVTFYGTDVSPQSDIATLLVHYKVGGVVLLAENGNFPNETNVASQVYGLTTQLQELALEQGQPSTGTSAPNSALKSGPAIPLFVGIEHGSGHWPYTYFLPGVTPVPSNMALGATWEPAFAEATGQVAGQELSALGINLLLGPSADVVEPPHPLTTGDMGVRIFGGESFWVSQMVTAYVRGLHIGSNGRLAVVPGHFPGYGGADRLASVEVPTVRRSLDQLTQFDLQPFFSLTGEASDLLSQADGVMTGHIRYLGFQGDNPRLPTRPISLDAQALQVLMKLDQINSWRTEGGLVVSDALGRRGVRRFYDPQETTFPNRRIAQDAFLAGNDILFLGNFGRNPASDQTLTIIDTIDFFVQQYREEPAFQARVDESVRWILRKKLDLYGSFELNAVLPDPAGVETVGQQVDVTFDVAQNALTLLFPSQADLLTSPGTGDQIVIFTDSRTVRQCSTCSVRSLISPDALQSAILRLYGPQGSGLVSFANVHSFTFEQLETYLEYGPPAPDGNGPTAEPDLMTIALDSPDWIVFVMLNVERSAAPSSEVVKRFLAESPFDPGTQIVVMAMDAPYYLDSTEISKLTAYYALYGYSRPHIDVAARALFQQISLNGVSPVSVAGVGYGILQATAPDPNQVIKVIVSSDLTGVSGTLTPVAEPVVGQGDTLYLKTGPILDQNGHPVPDGTPVDFILNYVNEGLRDTKPVITVAGVASTNVALDRPGELWITATSNPAMNSDTVQLIIPDSGSATITLVLPNIPPTSTPTPTDTPTPQLGEATIGTPTPARAPVVSARQQNVDFGDLVLSLFGLVLISLGVFALNFGSGDINYRLFLALLAAVVGLISYNYYALALPGAILWHQVFGDTWGAGVATWSGALLGPGVALLLLQGWRKKGWLAELRRKYYR